MCTSTACLILSFSYTFLLFSKFLYVCYLLSLHQKLRITALFWFILWLSQGSAFMLVEDPRGQESSLQTPGCSAGLCLPPRTMTVHESSLPSSSAGRSGLVPFPSFSHPSRLLSYVPWSKHCLQNDFPVFLNCSFGLQPHLPLPPSQSSP